MLEEENPPWWMRPESAPAPGEPPAWRDRHSTALHAALWFLVLAALVGVAVLALTPRPASGAEPPCDYGPAPADRCPGGCVAWSYKGTEPNCGSYGCRVNTGVGDCPCTRAVPPAAAPRPQLALSYRPPAGHTHTCPRCGTTWDHQANPGHTCQRCGTAQYLQDPSPRPVAVWRVVNTPAPSPQPLPTRGQQCDYGPAVAYAPPPPAAPVYAPSVTYPAGPPEIRYQFAPAGLSGGGCAGGQCPGTQTQLGPFQGRLRPFR